ncbi:glucuronosyltransferase (plasmid) [Agrobacterium sp. MA01]|uniref:glycosyltransferase n=1 Tax=Agrobacterium sp. MA01 TaxID=2664893 RepID=UPI00129A2545|nr:glycosyltransferase [Agrobacterium sp. MA01]QGG93584.1 glucuronosyltransferase [Agrobacterium sp. MA01]
MIFLTLGTQLPFDRLVAAVDEVVPQFPDETFFGQIGRDSKYRPRHFEFVDMLKSSDYDSYIRQSRAVVSHAGIGTILSAQRNRKPLIAMARSASLGEHRNNHQISTAAQLSRLAGLHVVSSSKDIAELLVRVDLPAMHEDKTPERDLMLLNLAGILVE